MANRFYKLFFDITLKRIGFAWVILMLSQLDFSLMAQQEKISGDAKSSGDYRINWVKQYPASKGPEKDPKLLSRLFEFAVGKKSDIILGKPVAVIGDSPDFFWVLDQSNGLIFKVKDKLGDIPHFWEKKYRDFKSLVWLSRFSDGRILFTDSNLTKVFVFNPDKKTISVLNDSLDLSQPTGIAWSSATNQIWVVETKAHRITILDEKGTPIKTIGKRGSGPSEFNYPTSIWIDQEGKACIVDAMNFRIQVFSKDGELITVFGEIGDATGYFARPKGIATDSYGNIYVADALFHTVQIFDKTGRYLSRFGSQGREPGEFWMPSGIYIDEKNYIYVADTYNSRVQVFQLINQSE